MIRPTNRKWNSSPYGKTAPQMKIRLSTRFRVPPKPETITAGLGCFRSRKSAPSPVDSPEIPSDIATATPSATTWTAGGTMSIRVDTYISVTLTTIIPTTASANFDIRTRRMLTGDKPTIQKPCPSRLSCGYTNREPSEHITAETLKTFRKTITFRHSAGSM